MYKVAPREKFFERMPEKGPFTNVLTKSSTN